VAANDVATVIPVNHASRPASDNDPLVAASDDPHNDTLDLLEMDSVSDHDSV